MAVTTWTSGQVLTAADLNDTLASKVDYALPTNAQTGTAYTFVAADAEKLTTASNGSAVTLTIPPASSVAWPDETILRVVNYGAGAVTIDGGSGVTVTNTSSTIAQYGAAVAIRTGSDAWTVVPFGGGDVPPATVSSPAATGQYTDTGITYDYYTFTSSGTLTVDTAGLADVLVVGGGGATGSQDAGGGGAGGMLVAETQYLPTGTHTVTVGAGGAGGAYPALGAHGSTSKLLSLVAPGGGSGGSDQFDLPGGDGGSGGGGAGTTTYSGHTLAGGVGTTSLGNNGGNGFFRVSNDEAGGGGGGAGTAGANATSGTGGNGGNGLANSFTGSSVTYAGGGGGGGRSTGGSGGTGGGGAGSATSTATAGTANTGGGGGGPGGNFGGTGSNGGSGVIIVRVKV